MPEEKKQARVYEIDAIQSAMNAVPSSENAQPASPEAIKYIEDELQAHRHRQPEKRVSWWRRLFR